MKYQNENSTLNEYWNEILKRPNKIIINGICYYDGGYNTNNEIKGFNGRVFFIKNIKSGKVFLTNNLWHNGTVPNEFHIKDTHEFISKDEYEKQLIENGVYNEKKEN